MANPPKKKSNISLPGSSGSRTISMHTERTVKVFAIQEPELEAVSYLSMASTICFSIGSFFFNEVLTEPKAKDYVWVCDKLLWAVVAFYLFAGFAIIVRKGIIGRIKRDSKAIGHNEPKRSYKKGQNKTIRQGTP